MKEDLHAYGNELNYYVVSCEFIHKLFHSGFWELTNYNPDNTAYVLGQIPLMTLQTQGRM